MPAIININLSIAGDDAGESSAPGATSVPADTMSPLPPPQMVQVPWPVLLALFAVAFLSLLALVMLAARVAGQHGPSGSGSPAPYTTETPVVNGHEQSVEQAGAGAGADSEESTANLPDVDLERNASRVSTQSPGPIPIPSVEAASYDFLSTLWTWLGRVLFATTCGTIGMIPPAAS
ncbi:hypothetical protein OH77DRAFT_1588672 [Trametes cingulata]|nr:hypothetical protein OH77DRAFT_1588672 [Trametes cingulata]